MNTHRSPACAAMGMSDTVRGMSESRAVRFENIHLKTGRWRPILRPLYCTAEPAIRKALREYCGDTTSPAIAPERGTSAVGGAAWIRTMWRIALSQIQLALAPRGPCWRCGRSCADGIPPRRAEAGCVRLRVDAPHSKWRRIQRFQRPLHNGRTSAATRHRHSGSIYGVDWGFQPFRINDLEMVAQICPRWNRLQPWFELVGAFKDAA
jgi:hypothetical protein